MDLRNFFGKFDYALDEKNRLSIPAKYRKVMSSLQENTFIICAIDDTHLTLYPYCSYSEEVVKKINEKPQFDPDASELRRKFGSESVDVTLDNQGRIMLPADLCQHAGINHKVKVIGCLNTIELWSPETYEEYSQSSDHKSIKEELEHLNI
ncbi:MAG TPA: division/cell wall cluster transcriptional repressor MraZ [bacterium]